MIIENIILAFGEVLTIKTVLLMTLGVAGGLVAGAIPGFTIAMAVVLTLPFTGKKATEDAGLKKSMDAKGTDVEWVGPADYRKWANMTFEDHKKVAIKIGMYKGK